MPEPPSCKNPFGDHKHVVKKGLRKVSKNILANLPEYKFSER